MLVLFELFTDMRPIAWWKYPMFSSVTRTDNTNEVGLLCLLWQLMVDSKRAAPSNDSTYNTQKVGHTQGGLHCARGTNPLAKIGWCFADRRASRFYFAHKLLSCAQNSAFLIRYVYPPPMGSGFWAQRRALLLLPSSSPPFAPLCAAALLHSYAIFPTDHASTAPIHPLTQSTPASNDAHIFLKVIPPFSQICQLLVYVLARQLRDNLFRHSLASSLQYKEEAI